MTEEILNYDMKIPILSKLNDKINTIQCDLNSLGSNLVGVLETANENITGSLSKSTEDIKKTSETISVSADSMSTALTETTQDIKETAEIIAKSADSIAHAVENFTSSTTNTINQFERAIEKSVTRLVATIEDFKNEVVQGGVKVNMARSASSLVPRPVEGGIMQGITSGIRDMIIPKRKMKEEKE